MRSLPSEGAALRYDEVALSPSAETDRSGIRRPASLARFGRIDRSHLGSIGFGVVGHDFLAVIRALHDAEPGEVQVGADGDRNRRLNSDPVPWAFAGDVRGLAVLDAGCGPAGRWWRVCGVVVPAGGCGSAVRCRDAVERKRSGGHRLPEPCRSSFHFNFALGSTSWLSRGRLGTLPSFGFKVPPICAATATSAPPYLPRACAGPPVPRA